jgi:hypothetical protein
LSRKAVYNWVEKRGKYFADDEEVETKMPELADTTVKRLLCCRCLKVGVGYVEK